MNTYEKLVYLASEPFDRSISLYQKNDGNLKSYHSVLRMLDLDFKENIINHQTSIDMRQACETKVVGI